MKYDRKNWKKNIEVNGVKFNIGYQFDQEFSGPIFEMQKNGKFYAALMIAWGHDTELGFNSGIYATEEEIIASKKAWSILEETEV